MPAQTDAADPGCPASTELLARAQARSRGDKRFMWLTPDRILYVGLLGAPTVRSMGSVNVYLAPEGPTRVSINGGPWQSGPLVVVQPHVPHQGATDGRLVQAMNIEAETVDLSRLPPLLKACGVVDDPAWVERARDQVRAIGEGGHSLDLASMDFDDLFFGRSLVPRTVDARIQRVIDNIKRDPSVMATGEDCAESVNLSFSRFLHLFRQEVGAPFRSFRTWKRARSLLHYVNRDANLAHIALDTGYPDSTHFSHSIRQVYGLKPKDIFAGSRRLAIYAPTPLPV